MKNKNIISRNENFAEWYTSVIKEAKLIAYAPVKGTMFFLPNGWSIWNKIQQELDRRFNPMGIKNVQLPLFIKYSDFILEKKHVQGFAPEIFLVTHNNKTELTDPLVVRPTSEILFCQCFKEVLNSYNDLPILYNQWCSVTRVEKNTRPFLRNTEFHWQELHGIFAKEQCAIDKAKIMIETYRDFCQDYLCIPVLMGEKTINERFAGAENTYAIEALMQDGQALQCATSHYLGQNFSNTYDLKYQDKDNTYKYVYQISSGVSTRIIGGIIMSHSDDNGLVLPFKVAPVQIAIVTLRNDESSLAYAKKIANDLEPNYRVELDNSDKGLGFKISSYQIQGVPFVIIIGPKEIEQNQVSIAIRTSENKINVNISELKDYISNLSKTFDQQLFDKASMRLNNSIVSVENIAQLQQAVNNKQIVLAYFNDTIDNEIQIKQITGATARCIKEVNTDPKNKCILTGQPATHLIYFARAY